jgi:hypothetical protein
MKPIIIVFYLFHIAMSDVYFTQDGKTIEDQPLVEELEDNVFSDGSGDQVTTTDVVSTTQSNNCSRFFDFVLQSIIQIVLHFALFF